MAKGCDAHVSELNEADFSQRIDDFAADFIGNVELHHAHVRRAERRVLCRSHRDGWSMADGYGDGDDVEDEDAETNMGRWKLAALLALPLPAPRLGKALAKFRWRQNPNPVVPLDISYPTI